MNPAGENGARGEVHLRDYLEELREDPPRPDPEMSDRIVRRARWQGAARGPLQAVGMLLAAVVEGLSDLLGADRGPRR